MTLDERTLQLVGLLSAPLAEAIAEDSPEELAALVAASQLVWVRATVHLAGRVSAEDVTAAEASAVQALGW